MIKRLLLIGTLGAATLTQAGCAGGVAGAIVVHKVTEDDG